MVAQQMNLEPRFRSRNAGANKKVKFHGLIRLHLGAVRLAHPDSILAAFIDTGPVGGTIANAIPGQVVQYKDGRRH